MTLRQSLTQTKKLVKLINEDEQANSGVKIFNREANKSLTPYKNRALFIYYLITKCTSDWENYTCMRLFTICTGRP